MNQTNLKRLFAALAVLCILVCAAGCSGVSDGGNPEKNPGYEATEPSEPEQVSTYENITQLDSVTAQQLLDILNTYYNFGVCGMSEMPVDENTTQQVLLSAGYDREFFDSFVVKKVPCCQSGAQMLDHISHYIGTDLIARAGTAESPPVAYNGEQYAVIGARGYGGYYMLGQVLDQGDGTARVTVRYDFESEDQVAVFRILDGTWKLTDIHKVES